MAENATEVIRTMRALEQHALARVQGPSAQLPHGIRVVPAEPTPKMLEAALLAEWAADPKDSDKYHAAVYRAMLARAPKQPDGSLRGRQQ